MANSGNSIKWDVIRELPASSLTTVYQPWGGPLLRDSFRNWLSNATNGDCYVSDDGVNDKIKLASTSGRAYDNKTDDMYLRAGTQLYIRFAATPGVPSGWAAFEVEYV